MTETHEQRLSHLRTAAVRMDSQPRLRGDERLGDALSLAGEEPVHALGDRPCAILFTDSVGAPRGLRVHAIARAGG